MNNYSMDFNYFGYLPTDVPHFADGYCPGADFGVYYDWNFSTKMALGLRLGLSITEHTLENDYSYIKSINDQNETVREHHSLTSDLLSLAFEPTLKYEILPNISVKTGLGAAYRFASSSDYYAVILQPDNYYFDNNKKFLAAKINEDVAPNYAAYFVWGAEYLLPIRTLPVRASLDFSFSSGYYDLGNFNIDFYSYRLGLKIFFNPHPKIPEPETIEPEIIQEPPPMPVAKYEAPAPIVEPEPVKEEKVDTLFVPPAQILTDTSFNLFAVGNNGYGSVQFDTLYAQPQVSTLMLPILNYVFFDDDKTSLPERYNMLTKQSVASFSLENLANANAIEVYHNVLNIVGSRMLEKLDAKLFLQPLCSEGKGFGKERAEFIRNYLIDIWQIDDDRIQIEDCIESGIKPKDSASLAELGRVELRSNDNSIFEPLVINDTTLIFSPANVKFFINSKDATVPVDWKMPVCSQNDTIIEFGGRGTPPPVIDWEPAMSALSFDTIIAKSPASLHYSLLLTSQEGVHLQTKKRTARIYILPLLQSFGSDKAKSKLERFNLILFDFDKSDIKPESARIIDFINTRIKMNSYVTVNGYTDNSGDEAHNLELSRQRAKRVFDLLKAQNKTFQGYGENGSNGAFFDNNLPEGRFYNRTVEVVIETPEK